MNALDTFQHAGYVVIEQVIHAERCDMLIASLPEIESSGSRVLLSLDTFRELARDLRESSAVAPFVADLVAVQCILFRKTSEHNWAVGLHRDEVLPIQGQGRWDPAGSKEGLESARPPREFMNRCVAIRVHLDGAPVEDISVVPGSHLDSQEHERHLARPIVVGRGGALIMRPSLVHASSRLRGVQSRRVLHFLFAPRELPKGYRWHDAV